MLGFTLVWITSGKGKNSLEKLRVSLDSVQGQILARNSSQNNQQKDDQGFLI